MKKKVLYICYICFILLNFSIIPLLVSCANKNKDPFVGPDGIKVKISKQYTMVPSLSEDYPDYYAICHKCGHIWKTQTEEICECKTLDNVEVFDKISWKQSKLYKSLEQENLLYADVDTDNKIITIGYRDGTCPFVEKYETNEEFYRDYDILWEGCGPAEYIYHGFIEASMPQEDGSAIFDETKSYPHRDIIYYMQDGDKTSKYNNKLIIETKDGYTVYLDSNV